MTNVDDHAVLEKPAATTSTTTTSAATTTKAASTNTTRCPAAATSASKPPKKKLKKSERPHCIIWVCTHGKGRSRNWTNNSLKLMGVYPTKLAAEQAKQHTMSQRMCAGHGDIIVGDTCWDEIDLVIREAPLFLDP